MNPIHAQTLIALAVLAASCGGTADPQSSSGSSGAPGTGLPTGAVAGSERPGSRLKHVWHNGNDSSVTGGGWYDTALKTRCQFMPVGGNVELCVPDDVYTLTYDEWNSRLSLSNRALYTDSGCTTSNVAALNTATCTKYGVVRVLPDATSKYVQACGGNQLPRYYVATALNPATPLYYYGVPAGGGACCSCQPLQGGVSGATMMAMELLTSANADKTQLVRAELVVDP